MDRINYNLKKLLKDHIIPEIHQVLLSEQLKNYGTLQYIKYQDGNFKLNLLDSTGNVNIETIKQIILSHDYLKGIKHDKIKLLKQAATKLIENKYPPFKQMNVSNGLESDEYAKEMKNFIIKIKALVDEKEIEINSKRKIETLEEVNIDII